MVYSHQASPQNAKINQKIKCLVSNKPQKFLNRTIPERKEFLKSSNLCSNYLQKHHIRNCTSRYRCFLCTAKNHTLVHTDGYSSNQPNNSSTPDQVVASVTNSSSHSLIVNIASPDAVQNSPEIWKLINEYSSLNKLLRAASHCLRFIHRICSKTERKATSCLVVNF